MGMHSSNSSLAAPKSASKPAPKPTIRHERRLARELVKEHNANVAMMNSTMERYVSKCEERMRQQELIKREQIDFLEKIISNLCQGVPEKASKVREKVKTKGLQMAERVAGLGGLEPPLKLPTMDEEALDHVVDDALDEAPEHLRHFVLDLEQVGFINSQAISVLITLHAAAKIRGARLVLATVTKPVAEILAAARLGTVLTICLTQAQLQEVLR